MSTQYKSPPLQGEAAVAQEGPIMKRINQLMAWAWWWLTFASWVVALGGLSAMQEKCADFPDQINSGRYVWGWNEAARLPRVSCGKVFSFEWWAIWLTFVVLVLCFLSIVSVKLAQAVKYMLMGFLITSTMLTQLAAYQVNGVLDTVGKNLPGQAGGVMKTNTRAAFAGFIMVSIAQYGLMYHIGVI